MAACPEWDYKTFDGYVKTLQERQSRAHEALRTEPLESLPECCETREMHDVFFEGLTPRGYPHYAGHYRGEREPCLLHYLAGVKNDSRVGSLPRKVQAEMSHIKSEIERAVAELDRSPLRGPEKLVATVTAVCKVHVDFLTTHPYADGNGHMARFILTALMGRFGYWPRRFIIDPRPNPPYAERVKAHRYGNPEPLEEWLLDALTV